MFDVYLMFFVVLAVRGLVSEELPPEVLTIMSHAVEARIRNCCERLNVIAEHRSESVRVSFYTICKILFSHEDLLNLNTFKNGGKF